VPAGFSFESVNARDYDDLRPDYAPEAVAWVASRCGLGPRSRVVDLAAGTGKLSKRFASMGVEPIAVEPAANMRALIRRGMPRARVVGGVAEALPLADASVDAVVVGNAFHHFDAARGFAEVRRVLCPGGVLAILWAWRTEESTAPYPALRSVDEAIEQVRAASPITAAYRSWERPPTRVPGFSPFERSEFPGVHQIPSARLADLYATSSDIASLPVDVRTDLLTRVRDASRGLPEVLRFPSLTVVDLCLRQDAGAHQGRSSVRSSPPRAG
jgi:SAM-dependent methyltransferase